MPSEAALVARIRELESELSECRTVLQSIADLDNCNYDDAQFISFTLNRIRHMVIPALRRREGD